MIRIGKFITQEEHDDGQQIWVSNYALLTPMAQRLMAWVLPNWLDLFLAKNRKYAEVDQSLGPAGVFPDINRKVGVLRRRIWDGRTSDVSAGSDESTVEIIDDLIGHLFLMRHLMVEQDALDGTAREHGPAAHQ